MIAAQELREDLYYRLRGFEIHLPPLRERREDIPLLANHFLGGEGLGFTPDAMEALESARWPGNVRELLNTVRSARSAAAGAPTRELPRGATLREIERDAIAQAIRDCKGNRTQAAQLLGIDRSTLRRKIKEFEIDATS